MSKKKKLQLLKPVCRVAIENPRSKEPARFDWLAAELCRGVRERGSLSQAASAIPVSYTKAWSVKCEVEAALRISLMVRHGQGSVLTKDGEALLEAYDAVLDGCQAAAERAYERALDDGAPKEEGA